MILAYLLTSSTAVLAMAVSVGRSDVASMARERGRAEFDISPDPRELREVRGRSREVLESWGLPPRIVEAAVLAAHEMVVNALMHARTAATLRLTLADGRLWIEVSDQSANEPRRSSVEPGRGEHGLGLTIVANLTDAWGYAPTDGGKTVWCELLL